MDLALDDVGLVKYFCDYYGLEISRAGYIDYKVWSDSIRYVYNLTNKKEKRDYVKRLKYSLSNFTMPGLFDRLMNRLCVIDNRLLMGFDEASSIQLKVKSKLGISHCHHACYDFVRGSLFSVKCDCCGVKFCVSIYKERELKYCSKDCSRVIRVTGKLSELRTKGKISRSFLLSKGGNKLQTFVNYLSTQQQRKSSKRVKGNFTWG